MGSGVVGAHALAAAWWCGTLAAMVLSLRGRSGWATTLPAFSQRAAWAVGVVAVTGVIAGLAEVGGLGEFGSTGYGRVLLAKLAGLLVLVGFGWWHRRRWVPAAGRHRISEVASIRAGVVEILLMAVVLGLAAGLSGEHIDLGAAGFGYTRREPLGIVAGIGAWNYPLQIACWKSAPALACGNAMIFKPAELTPMTASKLAEIMVEAGVPAGVFNVVQGMADTGRLLTRHPAIRKVSLTGEVGTGKAVMADAASTLKYVTLELGGKSPLIIFEDADIDEAVSGALLANFYSAGEVCSNGTRVFVQRSVKAAFLDKLLARVKAMRVGDPLDPATQVGALISKEHMEKVLGYIERGKAEGAKLLIGGERIGEGPLAKGFFVTPAVFDGCRDDMTIVREEIFGPVMTVLPFDDEAEVVERANDTEYGLAAGVFTRDLARGHRVVAQLQAGTCWINHYNITPIELPFGGAKLSGLGRENGKAAIEHYTQLKSVYVALSKIEAPY